MSADKGKSLAPLDLIVTGEIEPQEVGFEDREEAIHQFLLQYVLPDNEIHAVDRVRIEERVNLVRKLWNP